MKTILVIGLGRFGTHLIRKFDELDDEVMAVDSSEEKINSIMPYVTSARIGDCTNEDTLKSLGIRNFDICFVCIGDNFQNSLEITSMLKEMGAKKVISKASTNIHAKFLLRNGADEVVYPERDSAYKLAKRCSVSNLFDYIELTDKISIYEIPIIDSWIGKSIVQVDVRKKYNVNILAVKRDDEIQSLPTADYIFRDNDHFIIIGAEHDVEKLLKQIR